MSTTMSFVQKVSARSESRWSYEQLVLIWLAYNANVWDASEEVLDCIC